MLEFKEMEPNVFDISRIVKDSKVFLGFVSNNEVGNPVFVESVDDIIVSSQELNKIAVFIGGLK